MAKKTSPPSSPSQPEDVLSSLIGNLNTKFKSSVASRATEAITPDPLMWISTGLDELDFAINPTSGKCGLPTGRMIEIYGPESKGKSALSMQIAKSAQAQGAIVFVLDSESSFDKNFASNVLGVNLDKMSFIETPTFEDGCERIDSLLSDYLDNDYKTPMVIIWDTIAAAPTRNELDGDTYGGGIAAKPRGLSELMRRITQRLSKTRACLLLLNQIRSSLGQGADDSPGGWAIKHHASVRIQAKSSADGKFIKSDGGQVLGINAVFRVVKNKVGAPMREASVPLYFARGFSNEESLALSAVSLSSSGADTGITRTGSWYRISNPANPTDKSMYWRDLVELLRTDASFCGHVRERVRVVREAIASGAPAV